MSNRRTPKWDQESPDEAKQKATLNCQNARFAVQRIPSGRTYNAAVAGWNPAPPTTKGLVTALPFVDV